MKKLGKILVLCILATFVAGSALAVELAQEDVGDVLIFPVYAADATGWETKISVINTKVDESVVAKVVIRGAVYSQELLDFFIYLSPTDMWTATVYNDNGTVKIFSDDDSVLSSVNVWADDVPMDQPLQNNSCDIEEFGYITVFEAWNSGPNDTLLSAPPVDKDEIFDRFQLVTSGFDGVYANALTGTYEIKLPALGLSADENAVALQDYDVNAKLALGVETFLGQTANTTVDEVERELAKDAAFMQYYNDGQNISAHMFTFPTKKTTIDSDCDITSVLGPFWTQNTDSPDYCAEYGLKYFDLQENTPGSTDPIFSPVPEEEKNEFCDEWNVLVSGGFIFDEGWALYNFNIDGLVITDGVGYLGDTFTFTGTPVIPLVLNLGADGLGLHSAAFEFGTVTYTTAQ